MGTECRGGPGAGDHLIVPVAVDITTGYPNTEAPGAVGEITHVGDRCAGIFPTPYVRAVDVAGSGSGDDLLDAVAVDVAGSHVDPVFGGAVRIVDIERGAGRR